MLKNNACFSSFSVDHIGRAKMFYGEKLGLKYDEPSAGLLELFTAGGSRILVYEKPDHVPSTYTVLNFRCENIELKISELACGGIKFEHYEDECATNEKGIHERGGSKIAWFKDPAGNVLSLVQMVR